MKSYTLILTLMAAALMVGCRSQEHVIAEPEIVPPGSFVRDWTADTGFNPKDIKAFHFVSDMLFVYGPDNQVAAFDTAGGLKFRMTVGEEGDIVGTPIVQADRVLFPTSATIEIVSREGIRRKTIHLPQPLRSPPVAVENTVYAGVDSQQGGRIAAIALDRPYGSPFLWTRIAGGVVRTKPAIFENVLYFANENGHVVSLTNDPTLLWPRNEGMPDSIFRTDGRIIAAIRVDEGGVYVPSTDSKLYCLDAVTGKIRWEYFAGVPLKQSAVPTSDTLYIYIDGKGLTALAKRPANRYPSPLWSNPDALKVLADDAKYVYVLTSSNTIAALDKKTGVQQFATERNDFVATAAHINPKDNTLFAITSDKKLVSIRPVTRAGVVGSLVMADTTQEAIAAAR